MGLQIFRIAAIGILTFLVMTVISWAIDCEGNACKDTLFRIISKPPRVEIWNRNRDKPIKVCYGTDSTGIGCFAGGVVSCREVWPEEKKTFDMGDSVFTRGHKGVCPPISANYD